MYNFHTHTKFSDGKNTVEELILYAIEKGFRGIGFSDHGYTAYDLRYCMKDEDGYIAEVKRLKEKYKKEIAVHLGVEEDSRSRVVREKFEYIIGSCHYIQVGDVLCPVDSNYDYFQKALALCNGDELTFAELYYEHFCAYIQSRKPDLIGHFDLLTKFDEQEQTIFFNNEKYWEIAEKYTLEALKANCIFEVNTGLMARGYRTLPCPHTRLLAFIAKHNGKITLSSDTHQMITLGYAFADMQSVLRDIGFDGAYILKNGDWTKEPF